MNEFMSAKEFIAAAAVVAFTLSAVIGTPARVPERYSSAVTSQSIAISLPRDVPLRTY